MDGLPVELQAHIALFVGDHDYARTGARRAYGELLALRCVAKAWVGAVRRAAKDHVTTKRIDFDNRKGLSTRGIRTRLRLFGAGCCELDLFEVQSVEASTAIQNFVLDVIPGRLRSLQLMGSCAMSASKLLDLCRANPQLTEFYAYSIDHITSDISTLDSFVAELSRACPSLDCVELDPLELSPAEAWQMHFPQTKSLDFCRGEGYRPTRYDRIQATVAACVDADEVYLSECIVPLDLVEMLLRTPLKGRLRSLDLCDYNHSTTIVSLLTILRCVAGFEGLRELRLPDAVPDLPVDFYSSIVRKRPTLTSVNIGFHTVAEEACVRILVEGLALETLTLYQSSNLSAAIIDIILQSRSSQTLRKLAVKPTCFTSPSANVLRLVRGCPRLSELEWWQGRLSPIDDGSNVDEIIGFLKARGGNLIWRGNIFPIYGPWLPRGHPGWGLQYK